MYVYAAAECLETTGCSSVDESDEISWVWATVKCIDVVGYTSPRCFIDDAVLDRCSHHFRTVWA